MHKIITPVVTEPITLAEAKMWIRIDSGDFSGDLSTTQSIAPGAHGIASINGAAVEVLGYSALVNLDAGTASGTLNVHIEESDDNITFTDWTGGAFSAVTAANDNAVYEITYTGDKRYIRAVSVVTLGSCDFSVTIVKDESTYDEDSLISAFITGAREYAETLLRKALATQTLEMYMDRFPYTNQFELDMGPVQSVTSVKYKNSAGVETTMTPTTQYLVDLDNIPARIVLPYGVQWPSFVEYPVNPITVRYVAGYTTALPEMIKYAMRMHIGLMNRFRDEEIPAGCMKTLSSIYMAQKARFF